MHALKTSSVVSVSKHAWNMEHDVAVVRSGDCKTPTAGGVRCNKVFDVVVVAMTKTMNL